MKLQTLTLTQIVFIFLQTLFIMQKLPDTLISILFSIANWGIGWGISLVMLLILMIFMCGGAIDP